MRVLIACEFSGVVRRAFTALGHRAWSVDLLPADDLGQSYYPAFTDQSGHIQTDIKNVLEGLHSWFPCCPVAPWDLMIAHPPCTYLTNAGVRHLHDHVVTRTGKRTAVYGKARWEAMREGAEFFKRLLEAPIPRIAIENPIMHKYAVAIIGRRQDQVIQPWMFGHPEQKATCLWLKNLPKLIETDNVKAQMLALPKSEQQKMHYLPPSKDRWKLRSKTFEGIARAMATQWGNL